MKLNIKVLSLKDELGNFLALIKHQLEGVTKRALDNPGDKGIIRDMVDLTKCFEAATRSKIAIDKAEKKKEDSLTPDEELEEIKIFLMDFDHKERLDIVNDLISRHNTKCTKAKKPFLIRDVDNGR